MENNENLKNLISKLNKELGKTLDDVKNFDISKLSESIDKMTGKDKNDVVNAINAVSDDIYNWFGIKTKKWTVDDFKKEPVEDNSENESVKYDNADADTVDDKTESVKETVQETKLSPETETSKYKPFKRTIEVSDESDDAIKPSASDEAFSGKEDTDEQTTIPSWQDICNCPGAFHEYEDEDDAHLNDDGTIMFKHEWWKRDNTEEPEDENKSTIDETKSVYPQCHKSLDMYNCDDCRYNNICDGPLSEDIDEGEEETICEMLLQELKEFNTPEEEISLKVVNYVVDQLLDKTAHNYMLHPKTNFNPPSVEVSIPNDLLAPGTLDKSSILEDLICEELANRVGTETAELKSMDGFYIAYIPLE